MLTRGAVCRVVNVGRNLMKAGVIASGYKNGTGVIVLGHRDWKIRANGQRCMVLYKTIEDKINVGFMWENNLKQVMHMNKEQLKLVSGEFYDFSNA